VSVIGRYECGADRVHIFIYIPYTVNSAGIIINQRLRFFYFLFFLLVKVRNQYFVFGERARQTGTVGLG